MRKHLLSLCVIVTLSLVCSCAFSKPQKVAVATLAAQNSGFFLAQREPELAQEILEYSEKILAAKFTDFTESTFHEWAGEVMKGLKLHPFLVMNFEEMLKLANIEIELAEDKQEIVQLAHNVIFNFVKGIKVGKQA